jgi:EmrB/QacA subfamily drug resistance transporter
MSKSSSGIDPQIWRIAIVVLFGPLMSTLDSTVVNVSLDTLGRELHAPLSTIQWVTTGYLLALALTLPMTGWAVDRFGTKRVYLACFGAFTTASLCCGIANSASSLILFRVVQGMTGGLLAPMAQMTLARVAGVHMARVMTLTVMPVLLGPMLGPTLAGAILQHASWRWIFFINLPIGILATALAALVLPGDEVAKTRRRFDFLGFTLLAPGLVLLLYGLESLESSHVPLAVTLGETGCATMLIGWFVLRSLRSERATLIDIRLFAQRVFSVAAITQFSGNAVSFGAQLLLPLYLLTDRHMAPERAGELLAATGAGMLCTYPFIGALVERSGARGVAGTGAFVALCGTLPFAFFADSALSIPMILVALFVRGVGLSAIGIPAITSAYSSVPKDAIPVATTAMNIVQRLGGPVGTALIAVVLHARLVVRPAPEAFSQTFALLCVLQLFTLIWAVQLPKERVHASDRQAQSRLPAVAMERE